MPGRKEMKTGDTAGAGGWENSRCSVSTGAGQAEDGVLEEGGGRSDPVADQEQEEEQDGEVGPGRSGAACRPAQPGGKREQEGKENQREPGPGCLQQAEQGQQQGDAGRCQRPALTGQARQLRIEPVLQQRQAGATVVRGVLFRQPPEMGKLPEIEEGD